MYSIYLTIPVIFSVVMGLLASWTAFFTEYENDKTTEKYKDRPIVYLFYKLGIALVQGAFMAIVGYFIGIVVSGQTIKFQS